MLWTARTATPSWRWGDAGRWRLERIADHRRAFRTFEGLLTRGRGQVRRVDEGWFEPVYLASAEMVLDVWMRRFEGRVALTCLDGNRWRAKFAGGSVLL